MNQEEFDNKLNEAFKNEYLPPNEKLWQNISGRLDNNKKKPFWYWLMPLVLVVITATTVFFNGKKSNNIAEVALNNNKAKIENNAVITSQSSTDYKKNTSNEGIKDNPTFNDTPKNKNGKFPAIASVYIENEVSNIISTPKTGKPKKKTFINDNTNRNKITKEDITNKILKRDNDLNDETTDNPLNIYPYKKIPTLAFASLPFELIDYEPLLKNKTQNKSATQNGAKKDRTANFESKWWWSAGLGPQLAINNIKTNDTLEPYIHKDLWKNKKELTRNGTGFQSQFLLGYHFNNHFSIESGIQYSLRSESIRLDKVTDDIAFRTANNKVALYQKVILLAILQTPSGPDTTRYNAVQSFTMVANNKYHAFTVPIKLNFGMNITPATKFQLSAGLGITYLYAKKTEHLNMVTEEKFTTDKKSLFTASYNTQLAFYTNFNNYGEIGVYTGFQGYINRWSVINKQYSLGMSDMQLGLCFRRPF